MAQYSRKEVLDAAKNLAEMLANTEEIDRFKELEAKINASTKIQTLITKIKALQKQAVNLQAYDKKEALARVEEQLDRLQSELDGIPVVSEFKELQVTVNDVLQLVSTTISREVTNRIIEGTGGNVLEGKTGSTLTE
ncbi:RicAFT regulatory complex protein RicA family protein [Oceanobacillus alkalisoli]|uniref:RicAFT regulatory complex protein RicA family protein n=1 Tax=Oceanobacillus alkalisoli TaxID=2925113 RepID=UPI001EEFD60E|nr:YlbF family regulator [Oceanobacillus alkalisoli]MCF3942363.1 YlbF family regulator [Oceanobacillus alkalisoli]MCG5103420.1 YlbF family regulator [Oceanobacillus alkalisoli]